MSASCSIPEWISRPVVGRYLGIQRIDLVRLGIPFSRIGDREKVNARQLLAWIRTRTQGRPITRQDFEAGILRAMSRRREGVNAA